MRGPLVVLFSGLILAGAVVAGCGGGGGGSSPVPNAPGRSTQGNTTVQVKIVVPQKTNAQGKRVPKFVSPNTQSALIFVIGPLPTASPVATLPPNLTVGAGYTNINTSACQSGSSGLSCTISAPVGIAQAGEYAIVIYTLDQPQTSNACVPTLTVGQSPAPAPSVAATPCAGVVLGLNVVETQLTPGQTNPVNITLGGYPIYLQPVELVSGLLGGKGAALTVYGKSQAQVSFRLLDADKNVIASSIALQVGPDSLVAPSISTTPDATGLYTLSITPTTTNIAGQTVATTGTTALSITPSIMTGMAGNGTPISLPITVKHSVVYVANNSNQVDAYLDGNTMPAFQDYVSGSGGAFVGLGVNPNDESLWIADTNNNDVVTFNMSTPGVNPAINTTFCGIAGSCGSPSTHWENTTHVAFDAAGDAFLSTYNGSAYQIQEYDVPSPGATPNVSGAPTFSYTSPNSSAFCHLALDNAGNIYAGNMLPTFVDYALGLPTANTFINGGNINGVGFGPNGNIWYLSSATIPEQAFQVSPTAPTTNLTTIGSIPSGAYQGLAVDAAGNVYIASGTGTGYTEYMSPSFAPTTVGTTTSPQYVAVFPDGVFGANHPVGVAKPTQSPIPIASPVQI